MSKIFKYACVFLILIQLAACSAITAQKPPELITKILKEITFVYSDELGIEYEKENILFSEISFKHVEFLSTISATDVSDSKTFDFDFYISIGAQVGVGPEAV